jgi:hypothetical protein
MEDRGCQVGCAAYGADTVVAVDVQHLSRDVDRHGLAGVGSAEGDLLTGDRDDARVRRQSLDPDRARMRLRWWPGRAGTAQLDGT